MSQNLLHQIAEQVTFTTDASLLLEETAARLLSSLKLNRVVFWLLDANAERLIPHSFPNENVFSPLMIDGDTVIAQVCRANMAFQTDLAEREANDQPIGLNSEETGLLAAIPIPAPQHVGGVLMTLSRKPLSAAQVDALHVTAAIVGSGLAYSRLHAAERKRADLMRLTNRMGSTLASSADEAALFEQLLTGVHQMLGYDAVYLLLREGNRLRTAAYAYQGQVEMPDEPPYSPLQQGVAGRAARTGRSYIVRDTRLDPDYRSPGLDAPMLSEMAVPIYANQSVTGVIDVYSSSLSAFGEPEREALETLAVQVAIVIENAGLYQDAQRRLLEQSAIYRIGQDINTISDIPTLNDTIVTQFGSALSAGFCALLLYNSEAQQLSVQATYHAAAEAPPELAQFTSINLLEEFGSIIQPVLHLHSVLRLSLDDQGPSHDFLDRFGQTAGLAVPLAAAERTLGLMLWLDAAPEPAFTDGSQRLAQTLANQAAVSLERAYLQEETRQQLRREMSLRQAAQVANRWQEEPAMLAAFAAEIGRALHASQCLIYDAAFNCTARWASAGLELPSAEAAAVDLDHMPNLRQALAEGRTSLMDTDADDLSSAEVERFGRLGMRASLAVPLISQDRLVGMVEVLDDRAYRRFRGEDASLLEAMAGQVAVAQDNARLYHVERSRRALLEEIQRASQAIAGELQMISLQDIITARVAGVFGVPACELIMQDEQTNVYVPRAAHGLPEGYLAQRRISFDEFKAMYTSAQPVEIPDTAASGISQRDLLTEYGLTNLISIPLMRGPTAYAALNLYTPEPRSLNDNDQEMAVLLARQIAISLDNAYLFEVLEERAQQLEESNRLKSEFLANISHELRTPMNSIIGFTDTLLEGLYGPLSEKQESRLNTIKRNALHLLAIIDDLLDLSKIEAGKMEVRLQPVPIGPQLEQACEAFSPQISLKNLDLRFEIDPDLPPALVDEQRLRQVINNLVSNAVKFTQEGGLTIAARPGEISGRPAVHLSFMDTGIGITHESLEVIFDEFRQADGSSTRRYEGTGLGLAICRKLVLAMGGTIWAESTVGQGSTFHVLIPAKVDAGEAAP